MRGRRFAHPYRAVNGSPVRLLALQATPAASLHARLVAAGIACGTPNLWSRVNDDVGWPRDDEDP
jgi:hypothetical protein